MPTIVQINATANSGSTGKIAEQINQLARGRGWNTYLAYGRRMQPCESELIHVGNMFEVYEHYFEHRLFDNDGRASRIATRQLIRRLNVIKPDIIHVHNIHDHWLNYKILFDYLNTSHIPVVWTQHDCWSFTGRCTHFALRGCYKWRDGGCTKGCPIIKRMSFRPICEKTYEHYCQKSDLFTSLDDLTIVTVSKWLEGLVRQSFLSNCNTLTIHNGVDVTLFQPVDSIGVKEVRNRYGLGEGPFVIGVSSVWLPYKGWHDFLELSHLLPKNVRLVMVGLSSNQIEEAAKHGIIGIPHTDNVSDLAALYSGALITLNLSRQESFGLTTIEGLACGTPGLVYDTTASPELVVDGGNEIALENSSHYASNSGWVVRQGDIKAIAGIIRHWLMTVESDSGVEQEMRNSCRMRAVNRFNKDDRFAEYVELYENLLNS